MKPRRLLSAFLVSASTASCVVLEGRHSSSSSSASLTPAKAGRFGPNDCVSVERSSAGFCVIKTECHGRDTSSLEFAFDCWSASGDIFRHAYGKGGFGEQEAFDTEVQCAECHPPANDQFASPAAAVAAKAINIARSVASKVSQKPPANLAHLPGVRNPTSPAGRAAAAIAGTEQASPNAKPQVAGGLGELATRTAAAQSPSVSRYGPNKCISTWRSREGHCIVQTACQNVDISNYEPGLICTDSNGKRTRHVFGRGSFDSVETFDTLAECSKCVGLDDQRVVALAVQKRRWRQSAEASEVASLSAEVKTLTQGMATMLNTITKLRGKVKEKERMRAAALRATSNASPISTPRLSTAPAAPEAQVQSDDQVARMHHKHHHHHKHRKHRSRRVVEAEDADAAQSSSDGADSSSEGSPPEAIQQADEWSFSFGGGYQGPETNGIGEVLSDNPDAEASELTLASDGMDMAGGVDDGTSGFD